MKSSFPAKLFIEPTTRCNFSCEMCVKQTSDAEIVAGDMTRDTFSSLEPVFSGLESVVFSGIGEPLLHPGLDEYISRVRSFLPRGGWIGIQTNGCLITEEKIDSLIKAGLDTICISVDTLSAERFGKVREGGSIEGIKRAFEAINRADGGTRTLKAGIEFVLMKQNMDELPAVIDWAADHGASFVIVSHVLPYSREMEPQRAHSDNLNISRDLYDRYKRTAGQQNLNLDHYLRQRWRYHFNTRKKDHEQKITTIGESMVEEAYAKGIPIHFKNLIREDRAFIRKTEELFRTVRKTAGSRGVDLTLPELYPKFERQCHFVEENSAFISWDGQVYPCYFLWHQYTFFVNGMKQKVTAKSMGSLKEKSLQEIWNDSHYQDFRDKVLRYEYPYCSSCNLGPCNLFTAKPFEYDCYALEIPCGSCPWCGGLLHCLQ